MRTKNTIRFFNLSLVLLPILDIYDSVVSGISIGQLLLLVAAFLVIIEHYQYFQIDKSCFALLIYIVIRFLFSIFGVYANISVLIHTLISEILFIFFLITACNFFNLAIFRKYYLNVSIAVGVIAVIQFIFLNFFNKSVVFILPGLPLSAGVTRAQLITRFSRVESCFSEPAHLVQFLSVALILLLAKKDKSKTDYFKIIFFILICLLTYSGNAVVLLGLLYLTLCCITFKVSRYRPRVVASLIVIVISIFVFYAINEKFRDLIGRVEEITGRSAISISGYVRVLRGYELYAKFPLIYKLFGTGYGSIADFCNYFNLEGTVKISRTNQLYSYLNGIHYYLTGGGIVGFIIFLYLVLHGKGKNTVHTYSIILYFGLSMIAATQGSSIGLILLILILTNKQKRQRYMKSSYVGERHEEKQFAR